MLETPFGVLVVVGLTIAGIAIFIVLPIMFKDWLMVHIARIFAVLGANEKWLHKEFSFYGYGECKGEWVEGVSYSQAFPQNPTGAGMPYPEIVKESVLVCGVCNAIHSSKPKK